MPKAFLLKRNFSVVDTIEFPTPLISRRVIASSAYDEEANGYGRKGRQARTKVFGFFTEEDRSPKRMKYSYPADVCVGISGNYAAKRLSPENDFINNKKNSSGGKPTSNHSKEPKPKDQAGITNHETAVSDDEESNGILPFGHEQEEIQSSPRGKNCNGLNKTTKSKLNNLRKDRSEKTVHRCDQCGKVFKTKYTLSIHLKMPNHTESRPFVCNICGKGFRLSSTLCRHKIIHTQKKPHKCEVCNKSFNRSSTLKTHVRTHSEAKAFLCDICGKGFHQKGNLRNHIMIHTGEKPFKCSKCQRAFNKMSNLKFHMHTHTDNLPYQCKACRKRFTKKIDLKQHNEEVHEN